MALAHPVLERIGKIADREEVEAYVVGGTSGTLVLSKSDQDLDIVVMGDGVHFARAVAEAMGVHTVVSFERFGTAMLPLHGGKVEFVGARKEQYHPGSRKPDVSAGTLEEDLLRRDFTVNAMALSFNKDRFGELLDPLGGRKDLAAKILRTPLDPGQTFADTGCASCGRSVLPPNWISPSSLRR